MQFALDSRTILNEKRALFSADFSNSVEMNFFLVASILLLVPLGEWILLANLIIIISSTNLYSVQMFSPYSSIRRCVAFGGNQVDL